MSENVTELLAEREYLDAKAAYAKALARLRAAKKARPKPPMQVGSLEHKAQVREAIWQAYLAGDRNYGAMALRFERTRGNISAVINQFLRERPYGPITEHEDTRRILRQRQAEGW